MVAFLQVGLFLYHIKDSIHKTYTFAWPPWLLLILYWINCRQ